MYPHASRVNPEHCRVYRIESSSSRLQAVDRSHIAKPLSAPRTAVPQVGNLRYERSVSEVWTRLYAKHILAVLLLMLRKVAHGFAGVVC